MDDDVAAHKLTEAVKTLNGLILEFTKEGLDCHLEVLTGNTPLPGNPKPVLLYSIKAVVKRIVVTA